MPTQTMDLATFEAKADKVAETLKAIGNARRLMVLCKLVEHGEATVAALAQEVGLSQSALSQHLAVLREQGIVAIRREAQTIRYRIDDPAAVQVVATLAEIFCPPDMKAHR
jgi:DNA-binding transcriptional ArsR family regulator